jgi:hypothetical protein
MGWNICHGGESARRQRASGEIGQFRDHRLSVNLAEKGFGLVTARQLSNDAHTEVLPIGETGDREVLPAITSGCL